MSNYVSIMVRPTMQTDGRRKVLSRLSQHDSRGVLRLELVVAFGTVQLNRTHLDERGGGVEPVLAGPARHPRGVTAFLGKGRLAWQALDVIAHRTPQLSGQPAISAFASGLITLSIVSVNAQASNPASKFVSKRSSVAAIHS